MPEVFGDAILVNGKLFPYLEVEPRKYRFRVLNAANGRFFHLAFSNGQTFHQIGTDLGLLPAPVALKSLLLAPAERADLIVDFSGTRRGEHCSDQRSRSRSCNFASRRPRVADSSALPATLRPVPRTPEATRPEDSHSDARGDGRQDRHAEDDAAE